MKIETGREHQTLSFRYLSRGSRNQKPTFDAPNQAAGLSALRPWSDSDDTLLGRSPAEVEVFRVRFSSFAK